MRSNRAEESAAGGDDVRAAIDRARARLGRLASPIECLPTTSSTNDVALARCVTTGGEPSDAVGFVVVADQQTAGRGRRGHAWFSPPGSGLYVSAVVAPARARVDSSRATSLLTLAAGVGVAEGIARATGLRPDLKWPNDLLVGPRKLAGILAEAAPGEQVVVGYGINIAPAAYPPELQDRATSLATETGRAVDRVRVLVETLAALSSRYEDLLDGRFDVILDAWRALSPSASGAPVTWRTNAGIVAGVTAGIDDHGALLVRSDARIERIVSGEVAWL